MNTVFNTGSLVGQEHATLQEILQILQQTYCSTVGAEYMFLTDLKQKRWIQNRLEGPRATNLTPDYKRHILERRTAAESLKNTCIPAMSVKSVSLVKGMKPDPPIDKLIQHG